MSFEGKSVIISGGARGIGRAIVERFLKAGAQVSVIDPKPTELSSIKQERLHVFKGDVSNASDVENFINSVTTQFNKIDILINNAGIIRDNVIWRMPEEDFDSVLNVNLKGPWLMCKAVVPIMREHKYGRIINIVSRAWLGNFGQSNYSSSKGGLVSLTRVLALELARFNVTVNAVAPGLINTPMTCSLPPDTFAKLVAAQPGKKAGEPADITHAVEFLASKEAGFITGQVLHVDGGKSIGATVT